MKRYFLALSVGICAAFSSHSQSPKHPAPSPATVIKQNFSNTSIEITYSRPAMHGRKIFGGIVPFGEAWRSDLNVQITFEENVFIPGMPVSEENHFLNMKPLEGIEVVKFALHKGTYTLYMVPGEQVWKVFLNKSNGVVSASGIDPANKYGGILVIPQKTANTLESLTMAVNNIQNARCDVSLSWENTKIVIPVEADINKEISD